jgi:large-conductance mechanosensitive channel
MIQLLGLTLIVAVAIFIYIKNKQQNRANDRRNRLAEKQEELMKMLKNKNADNDN